MLYSYFTTQQILPLLISTLFIITSIITFHSSKTTVAFTLLIIGSFCLGYFIANLDPFLILWDEQYHALVAKNMLINPFKPTLYRAIVLPYDYTNWTANHIWLHKQPLFLWQIVLSLKVFGINEFSVRIPSIVLHTIIAFFIYRIGKIVSNKNVGYYGALFFSVAYYPLELIAGRYSTDHNDVAFLFYVTASFWAWFEYQHTTKKYWLILIGIFSGCAVLVKWLVGLLVYCAWFMAVSLTNKIKSFQWQQYMPIIYSMGISILIFLPWQLFIFHTYPKEAHYEFLFNAKHFFEIVEEHAGNIWFHFKALYTIYGSGDAIPFLLLAGIIILMMKTSLKKYKILILSAIIIIYGIYSIAATKMVSYCLIVSPFAFLGLGALVDTVLMFLKTKIKAVSLKIMISNVGIVAVCIMLLDLSKIQKNHTDWKPTDNHNREQELKEMRFINRLPVISKNDKWVIFNTTISVDGHIPIMFYTSYLAYNFIPDLSQINYAKLQAYKIMILDTGNLPHFIINDSDILKIKF